MPNINAVLNDQIRRLARREITAKTKSLKKITAYYRRDIAALKRQVAQLTKQMAAMQKTMPQQPTLEAPAAVVEKARLRIDGLKGHRARLGLSAKDYGKLMGVSGLTIYNWESGKSKPRRSQLPRIVAVRGIGKREAMQRLGMGAEKPGSQDAADVMATKDAKKPAAQSRKQGIFKQTAEEMILGLLKGRKALTAAQIDVAWKKEGRKGTAAWLLSKMTKAKTLKRVAVKGQRGGEYRAM